MALVDRVGEFLDSGKGGGVILTTLDSLIGWSRGQSLWSMPMGTACCAMEFIAGSFSKFDIDRHGVFPRPDPRHTDVMIVAGTITRKMQPAVKRLYEQMPEPKWVIAMGNCAVSGGIFYYDSYSVVRGVDEFIPVDVYISGCPPRPEAMQDAIFQLRELIKTESISPDRSHPRDFLLPSKGDVPASVHGEDSPGNRSEQRASLAEPPAETAPGDDTTPGAVDAAGDSEGGVS